MENCEPQTAEEYDREIAESVREEILAVARDFGVDKRKIDGLLLKLAEVGCDGIEIEKFKQQIGDEGLRKCFYELVQRLHDNYGGVLLIDLGKGQKRIALERSGRDYLAQYFGNEARLII